MLHVREHTQHSILLRFLPSLIFSPFQRVVSVASALSLSLSLSLSLYVEKLLSHCLSRCLSSCLSACPSSCLSSHLSYQLFIIFLPEKQRLSPAKDFNSQSVSDENKALWLWAPRTETTVNFSLENSLCPCEWGSQTASSCNITSKCNFITFQDI